MGSYSAAGTCLSAAAWISISTCFVANFNLCRSRTSPKKNLNLESPELVDYQIRIPRGVKTNALTEAIITWQVNGKRLQTIGIDSDQVLAAVNATLKLLNLQLLQKDVQQQ